MRRMSLVAAAVLALFASNAFAQGGSTSSISGVVVDSGGGVVPGADVLVKNNGTGESFTAVTSEQGVFSVPSLITGTYTVTVSLQGFKTVVLEQRRGQRGRAGQRARDARGRRAHRTGHRPERTPSSCRRRRRRSSTTLDTRQVAEPAALEPQRGGLHRLPARRADAGRKPRLDRQRPAAEHHQHDARRREHPGQHAEDHRRVLRASSAPRLDAIEEITFTPRRQRREARGMGATQIRFVTKSGTNELPGSVFHTYRSDELNANTWFNKRDGLPKPELLQNQPGFNVGGPIMLPGFDGREQGVLLRQLRGVARSRQRRGATARFCIPDGAAGRLPLQRRRRRRRR